MDLSKLPRLSETNKHAPTPQPPTESPPSVPPAQPAHRQLGSPAGAEAWITIAVGVIILLMYPRFLQWACSRLFGTHFNEFMRDGAIVPYTQVPEFWADLGPTTFGIMLIFEGLVLALAPRRALVRPAFVLTVAVTIFNFVYLVKTYAQYGLALVSALAVAFGVYIALHQWKLLGDSRA